MSFLFFIFVFSGFLKLPLKILFPWFPIDITLLSGSIMVVFMVLKVYSNRKNLTIDKSKIINVSLLLIFYVWMIATLVYTRSPKYSLIKTMYFSTVFIAFVFPHFYKIDLKKFIAPLYILLPVLSIWNLNGLTNILLGESSEQGIAGYYLVLGTNIGLLIVIIFFFGKDIISTRLKYIFVMILYTLLLMTGSRGPILFCSILIFPGYIYYFIKEFLNIKSKRVNFVVLGVNILVLSLLIIVINRVIKIEQYDRLLTRTSDRFDLLILSFTNDGYDQTGRTILAKRASNHIFDNISNNIFGYGIGSFGIIDKGHDFRDYPHNILLEIYFELGLIGIVLFLIFIISILNKRDHMSKYYYPLLFVSLYMFLNSLKSSGLSDQRIMFAFLGMFSALNYKYKEMNESDSIYVSD